MNKFHVIPCIITYCYIPPNHPNLHVPIIRVFFAIPSFDVICCPTLSYLQPTHTHMTVKEGEKDTYIHFACNAMHLSWNSFPRFHITKSNLYQVSIPLHPFALLLHHLFYSYPTYYCAEMQILYEFFCEVYDI